MQSTGPQKFPRGDEFETRAVPRPTPPPPFQTCPRDRFQNGLETVIGFTVTTPPIARPILQDVYTAFTAVPDGISPPHRIRYTCGIRSHPGPIAGRSVGRVLGFFKLKRCLWWRNRRRMRTQKQKLSSSIRTRIDVRRRFNRYRPISPKTRPDPRFHRPVH